MQKMHNLPLSTFLFTPHPPSGSPLMNSKTAAILGISQVVFSRIVMAMPGMTVLPVIMERLEKKPWMQSIKPMHGPIQVSMGVRFLRRFQI